MFRNAFYLFFLLFLCIPSETAKSKTQNHLTFQKTQNNCDFSQYKRLTSLEVTRVVIDLVKPQQPQDPKHCTTGKVDVKILIDKSGKLINACVVSGHPILKSYSIGAVAKWKFKKNFGLPQGSKISYRYAELKITFDFECERNSKR